MNVNIIFTFLLICLVSNLGIIYCDNTDVCYFPYNPKDDITKQKLRLLPLNGKKFNVTHEECVYTVAICSDVTTTLVNSSVTQKQLKGDKTKNEPIILGRRNDTSILGGGNWIKLTYESGDVVNSTCHGRSLTEIIISCSLNNETLQFLGVSMRKTEIQPGCHFAFELMTPTLCSDSQLPVEGLSNGSVFCIIVFTIIGIYLVGGMIYLRIVKGAKGCDQIPHHEFWRRLGNLQADGCDLVCRWGDTRREDSWRRLTNNFSDPQDDRDEPLLRP